MAKETRQVELSHDRFNELHSDLAKALNAISTTRFKIDGTAGLDEETLLQLTNDFDGAVHLLKRVSRTLTNTERVFTALENTLKQ